MTVPVTLTWMRSPLLPKMPLKVARMVQRFAEQKCIEQEKYGKHIQLSISPLIAEVVGYTTPAVKDIGAASLRIRFLEPNAANSLIALTKNEFSSNPNHHVDNQHKPDVNKLYNINNVDDIYKDVFHDGGGYLLAIRLHKNCKKATIDENSIQYSGFLPAIAGIPGKKGLDRYGNSRVASAELIVMGRPLANNDKPISAKEENDQITKDNVKSAEVTFFSEDTISNLFPVGSLIEVINVARVTDFFLGLNAGRWLTIRIKEICDKGVKHVILMSKNSHFKNGICEGCEHEDPDIADINDYFLVNALSTMKVLNFNCIEDPPEDASYLFHHWGSGGNSGVSGQKIVLEKEDIEQKL